MAARLSTRISLRWLPDPPSEPTDTIVLNVGAYFMDLRIRTQDGEIDWAMAGKRIVLSEDPLKCKWIHAIDSRGSTDPDEGTFATLDNGDELETGEMACPEKGGAVTPYEEVWRAVPVAAAERFPYAWILESEEVGAGGTAFPGKEFLGKVGGEFLSMGSVEGGKFWAKREVWRESEQMWEVKYEVGSEGVLSASWEGSGEFRREGTWKVGDAVGICGRKFQVVAWEDLGSLGKEAT